MYSYGNLENDEMDLLYLESKEIKKLQQEYNREAERLAAQINKKYLGKILTKELIAARFLEIQKAKKMILDPILDRILFLELNSAYPIQLEIRTNTNRGPIQTQPLKK